VKKIWNSRTGHRWKYGACTLHAGWLGLQTRTVCNTYCCTTAAVVTWTSVNITLYVPCLSCCCLLLTVSCLHMCRCSLLSSSGNNAISSSPWVSRWYCAARGHVCKICVDYKNYTITQAFRCTIYYFSTCGARTSPQ